MSSEMTKQSLESHAFLTMLIKLYTLLSSHSLQIIISLKTNSETDTEYWLKALLIW